MPLIKRDHFTTPTIQTVVWNQSAGTFTTSKRVNGSFEQVAVQEPFALDCHLARHGYESWNGDGAKRERKLLMTSVSDKMPLEPDQNGWKALYTVPVWSNELGGQRELVIMGEAPTGAFADLFDLIETYIKGLDEAVVPVISFSTVSSDYGLAPVFEIDDWMQRPDKWGNPIVRF